MSIFDEEKRINFSLKNIWSFLKNLHTNINLWVKTLGIILKENNGIHRFNIDRFLS